MRSACTQASPGLCAVTHERQSNRVSEAGTCTAFRSELWKSSAVVQTSPWSSISRPGETLLSCWTVDRSKDSNIRTSKVRPSSGERPHRASHPAAASRSAAVDIAVETPPLSTRWNFERAFRVEYHVVRPYLTSCNSRAGETLLDVAGGLMDSTIGTSTSFRRATSPRITSCCGVTSCSSVLLTMSRSKSQ